MRKRLSLQLVDLNKERDNEAEGDVDISERKNFLLFFASFYCISESGKKFVCIKLKTENCLF